MDIPKTDRVSTAIKTADEAQAFDETVRIAGTVDDSIVDGPGIRFTIFAQGCKRKCPGCHNPQSHDFSAGTDVTIEQLWQRIAANPLLSGITFSGGEPFEQAAGLTALAQRARDVGLSVWAYSGYFYDELIVGIPSPEATRLLELCDVLVDGAYIQEQRSLELKWRGSTNQRVIDVAASRKLGSVVELAQ